MYIKKLEIIKKRIITRWVNNQSGIVLLTILGMCIIFLRTLPYFNVYLTPSIAILIWWIIATKVLKIHKETSCLIAGFSLLFVGFGMLINIDEISFNAANFSYYLCVIIFIQHVIEIRHEKF
jgi:hypothetical protein